ncbi:MAG TPA: imidazole glycerol phosphate synthase subunit HisH [Actinomycetota bacterium]|nr:imidazole glycerol phosphate synthase subunit HisH [Actinomycetota bacterium]
MTIAVLDYGMGNLRSVARAIEHVGGSATVTADADTALGAIGLVVPGVGHFGACMANLRERGLDAVVKEFASSGRPVFGVCVGMQILLGGSEEATDVPGLGLLEGVSRRLPEDVKVPHMGWNEVEWLAEHAYVRATPSGTRFYFVHSYAPDVVASTIGIAEHGRPFAAAIARDNVFATQFHPEKSGGPGLALYRAFVGEVTP